MNSLVFRLTLKQMKQLSAENLQNARSWAPSVTAEATATFLKLIWKHALCLKAILAIANEWLRVFVQSN